jgi:hypothetical protein
VYSEAATTTQTLVPCCAILREDTLAVVYSGEVTLGDIFFF